MTTRLLQLAVVSSCALSCTIAAQTTGDLRGTVSDESGGALPGATVEAMSPSLQGTRVVITALDGTYRIPAVPPGLYKLKAALTGFAPAEKTATVTLDAMATADFMLQLSRQANVVVSGEASPLDATSAATGTSYTSRVVARLPVSRNYADIVRANPGVNTDQGDTQGRSLALTVYGATSAENQWVIDGINTTNVMKGIQGKAINNEFIEEVQVKTGGIQAEYGGVMGGVINVVTKSGGNEFHGDAFAYYDSFQTRAKQVVTSDDSVVSAMRVADYQRTDFGVDLGGFILKDRLWFFGAYNRIQTPGKVSRSESSPLVPDTLQFPIDTTDNLYSAKLTWKPGPGTTVVGTAFADPTQISGAATSDPRQQRPKPIESPDPATWESSRFLGGTDYALRLEQLFGSAALLTLQGSRHEDRYDLKPAGPATSARLEDYTCAGGTPDAPCAPPVFGSPNFATGGFGAVGLLEQNTSWRNQARADVGFFHGGHELKLGGEYREAETKAITSFSGGQSVRRYNEYGTVYYRHDFYARSPTDFTPVDVVVQPRTRDLGAYVQDTWRVAPGWTVNAGLRWDEEDIRDYRDQTILKTTAEWQPRLGVVWDPKRDGKTKIYAFAGRFYYAIPTDLSVQAYGQSTEVHTFNFDPASLVQDPSVLGHETAKVQGGAFAEPADAGLKGIYQDEYTLGVERLIGSGFTLGLKATYRRLGSAIEDRCDLDPNTFPNTCGLMNPGSDGPIARGDVPGCNGLDGAYANCTEIVPPTPTIPPTPPARRLYRGVEVLARKSVGDRLWIQASYVYSSLRGNYDGEVSNVLGGQTAPAANSDFDYPALLHNGYGRLYLDRPHAFRLDGFYTTPFKLSVGLQTWVRSGAPLNRQGYFSYWYGAVVQLDEKGYAGRLPTEWDANLVLTYPIVAGPVTVVLQAFVFNLFNNQIPTSQNTSWTTQQPADYPASLYDPNQPQNNPEYGKVTGRQEPRLLRGSVKVSF